MVHKQVIVEWYTPEEKKPPEDIEVICTINGRTDGTIFENALVFLSWDNDEGWFSMDYFFTELEVVAWCDLKPYDG